ncbi:MAG: V-type ATP synthase subunit D [Candidatus Margulisbacteria bacterium]|nr:V-type ATP synthase subunit D [Candidatus Margulisiibacteriota bacterium]
MAKRVNATRMELLRLRRRTLLARKGHKLLKDKLDGLIQRLLEIVKARQRLSNILEQELAGIFQQLVLSSAQLSPESLYALVLSRPCTTGVEISIHNIMGVRIPRFELKIEGDPLAYGSVAVPAELDPAISRFREILKDLVKLAEYNKAITVIAAQIIEIKRRVNALEYVLIPELENAVAYIRMKLAEMERSAIVTLLKIKDIVRSRS